MRWPQRSAESVRPSRFHPPFCPWPACAAHRVPGRGFQRFGSYRKPSGSRRIPRFRCRTCQRTRSRQTFSTTYYLKRPALLAAVASGLAACSAHRQIARSSHCSKTSVTRMAERLGRHAILFHERCRAELPGLSEAIVHDHWGVFVGRQDRALGIGTAVGAQSTYRDGVGRAAIRLIALFRAPPRRRRDARPPRKADQIAPVPARESLTPGDPGPTVGTMSVPSASRGARAC
jgi:hypothetical protein